MNEGGALALSFLYTSVSEEIKGGRGHIYCVCMRY